MLKSYIELTIAIPYFGDVSFRILAFSLCISVYIFSRIGTNNQNKVIPLSLQIRSRSLRKGSEKSTVGGYRNFEKRLNYKLVRAFIFIPTNPFRGHLLCVDDLY